jgi:hypothetical protein
VHAALGAQVFEPVEEVFAGELVAEQAQLQRARLPGFAHVVVGAQDDLVDRRAERILGGGDVVGRHAERLGVAVDVAEEARHVVGKGGLVVRAAAVLQQEQRVEALVHQVDQEAGRCRRRRGPDPGGAARRSTCWLMPRSQSVRV